MLHVTAELSVSQRLACRVLDQHRSTQHKAPRRPDDEAALTQARSCPSTWWKLGVAEVVADHAAWVEIWVGTASVSTGVSSAIASVCM